MKLGNYILLVLTLLTGYYSLSAQNQARTDSLKSLLTRVQISSDYEMMLYSNIAALSPAPDEMLLYADKLLKAANKYNKPAYVVEAYQSKGVAYRLMGNLKFSLKNLFSSAELAIRLKDNKLLSNAYLEIANTYTANNDFRNAIIYNNKAIVVIRRDGAEEQLAISLLNTGFSYYKINEFEHALKRYDEAGRLFDKINFKIGKAYTIGNRSLVYWKKKQYGIAEKDLLKAIGLLGRLGDTFGMADYHNQLGRLYAETGNIPKAISHTQTALELAKNVNLKEQIRDASLHLSELFEQESDFQKAHIFQRQYIVYKDSIENSETTRQIANLRTDFEVSQKEKEIVLLEKRELLNRVYIIIIIFLFIFAVLLSLYFRQRFKNTKLLSQNDRKLHDENIRNLLIAQETKTLQSMVQGQENERQRLAKDLHNHFGSLMATIKVNLNGIEEKSISNYSTLVALVDQACNDIRNLSHSLNIGISEDFGLVPALKELTEHLEHANGLEVEFTAAMSQEQMSSENEIVIYRIIQELVSNVLKHAGATKLSILLTCFDDENIINIMVQDNGKGFEATETALSSQGMGIKTLIKIIGELGGEIRFDSNPASGTTINIDMPITKMTLN